MSQVFYLNGNKDGKYCIGEDSALYNFLSDNYYLDFDDCIVIGEDVLDAIQNSEVEFSDDENVLIGFMLYHLEYTGGFIFS